MARPKSLRKPREIFCFSNVVKYEGEPNRNLQGATKIETLLCAAVGTANRQNGEV